MADLDGKSSGTPSSPAPDAAAWLARGQALEAEATPASLAEAVRSYECAIAVLAALPPSDPAIARDLAVAHMNRGNALQKILTAESLPAAVAAYDQAIAIFRAPPLGATASGQNALGAAWMNRGHALHRQATPEAIAEAAHSHRQAIMILQELPLNPGDDTPVEAALNHRLNLAGAWVNLASVLLASPALPERFHLAREASAQTIGIVSADDLASQHPVAAELSLLGRRARCDALGQLLPAAPDTATTEALAAEASDIVDDGLALARLWEQRGVSQFRPLSARLYHFGAQLYRLNQPHFLAEFLLEHLDPAQSPGATPDDPTLHAIAAETIAATLRTLRAPRMIREADAATLRQVDTLRDLQAAEQRLAALRQAHLPSAPPGRS